MDKASGRSWGAAGSFEYSDGAGMVDENTVLHVTVDYPEPTELKGAGSDSDSVPFSELIVDPDDPIDGNEGTVYFSLFGFDFTATGDDCDEFDLDYTIYIQTTDGRTSNELNGTYEIVNC